MFVASSGAFSNTAAFVIRKSSILSGGPVVATAFRTLIGADGMLDPRGVDNDNPGGNRGLFHRRQRGGFQSVEHASHRNSGRHADNLGRHSLEHTTSHDVGDLS